MRLIRLATLFLLCLVCVLGSAAQGPQITPHYGPNLPPCSATVNLYALFTWTAPATQGVYSCQPNLPGGFAGWVPVGQGSVKSGLAGQIPFYQANGNVLNPDPCMDDGITSANTFTYKCSGGIQTTGGGSGLAGKNVLGQGTSNTPGQCGSPLVNCIGYQAPATVTTPGLFTLPQKVNMGLHMASSLASNIAQEALSGDSNHSVSTLNATGNLGTFNLCSVVVGGCNTAGQYVVYWTIRSTGTCATPGSAGVTLQIGWTDDGGNKTLIVSETGVGSSGTSVALGNLTNFGYGSIVVYSTGSVAITYATVITACTSGTAQYSLGLSAVQVF